VKKSLTRHLPHYQGLNYDRRHKSFEVAGLSDSCIPNERGVAYILTVVDEAVLTRYMPGCDGVASDLGASFEAEADENGTSQA
jgi:hypothetical protein